MARPQLARLRVSSSILKSPCASSMLSDSSVRNSSRVSDSAIATSVARIVLRIGVPVSISSKASAAGAVREVGNDPWPVSTSTSPSMRNCTVSGCTPSW